MFRFHRAPAVLDRVQVWGVAGETFDAKPIFLGFHIHDDVLLPVRREPVPDHKKFFAFHMAFEVFEEGDGPVAVQRSGDRFDKESRFESSGRCDEDSDHGELLP